MRYIKKENPPPNFFITDTKVLLEQNGLWKNYRKKRKLKKHILKEEQDDLCIYCESQVNLDNSHIEHIKPQSNDLYPELRFEYSNLTVSCNGNIYNECNDKTSHNCGHKKDEQYCENEFLNPTTIENIRDYFQYDYDDFKIKSSSKDDNKSKYMINVLRLNDGGLPIAREIALGNFINKIKNIKNIKQRKNKMKEILSKENIAFISFLKYKYKEIIK